MVSRRKILSRSRDDLNMDQQFVQQDEEDVWYNKDKLFKEHIQEVLDKWEQIDDEIWAKVIVFERNRRVAKAYARTPVLTVNGAEDGFDGMRIGLCGFDNPMRDLKTTELKRQIGQGIKLKMDDAGNILIRRYARSGVFVKATSAGVTNNGKEENSISAEILKLPGQSLETDKVLKLFDMKKFQSNINRELRQAYPDRRRLELQCLSAIAFVKAEADVLECPVWVLIVNVVAMDLLKSKLPPINVQRAINAKSRPRLPIPDEDPYSIAGNTRIAIHPMDASDSSGYSGGSGGGGPSTIGEDTSTGHSMVMREQLYQMGPAKRTEQRPPQLPPRDNNGLPVYGHDNLPTPDYDDEIERKSKPFFSRSTSKTSDKNRKKYVTEDPYYCGLSARVPKFDNKRLLLTSQTNVAPPSSNSTDSSTHKKPQKKQSTVAVPKRMSVAYLQPLTAYHQMNPAAGYQIYASQQQLMGPRQSYHQQMMWHARSMESGLDYPSEFNANHYGADRHQQMHRMSGRRPV